MQATQYTSLREKIAAEKAARIERYAAFEALFANAYEAGLDAGANVSPTPMHVVRRDGSLVETVKDGACGFAWVVIKPANSSFGKWLQMRGLASKAYGGGLQIWISAHHQSYERKLEHARAMAQHFRNAGINAYASGRLD